MQRVLIRVKRGFCYYERCHCALFRRVISHCPLRFCFIPFQQIELSDLLYSEHGEGCRACISSMLA